MSDSFERLRYENAALWDAHRWGAAQRERARLTVERIPPGVQSILDVGCGSGRLTEQLKTHCPTVGIDRSYSALRLAPAPRGQADAVALPFRDGAFDLVVAAEVLEHLPVAAFAAALAEIVRAARSFILISVPYEEDLDEHRVTCPQCGCGFHRDYHMRSFALPEIAGLFAAWPGIELVEARGVCPGKALAVARLRHAARAARHHLGWDHRTFPASSMCPQCGFSRGGAAAAVGAAQKQAPGGRGRARSLLVALLARRATYRWWLALYEKE